MAEEDPTVPVAPILFLGVLRSFNFIKVTLLNVIWWLYGRGRCSGMCSAYETIYHPTFLWTSTSKFSGTSLSDISF